MSSQRLRTWLMASAIFVLGVTVGGALVTTLGMRMVRHALQNPSLTQGPAFRAAERISSEIASDLNLSSEEAARVKRRLNETAAKLRQQRVQFMIQAVDEFRRSARAISVEIPPEKREAYLRLISQRFERLGVESKSEPPMTAP